MNASARGSSSPRPRRRCRTPKSRKLVAAEIMGGIYFEILQRIERRGYDVFTERVRVPKLARARIALQIWALSQLSAIRLDRDRRGP